VAQGRLAPSNVINVATPHAVATVRGTILVVEVAPRPACDGDTSELVSRITVLTGKIEVAARNSTTGAVIGPPVSLGIREAVTVSRCAPLRATTPLTEEAATVLESAYGGRLNTAPPATPPTAPRLPRLHP